MPGITEKKCKRCGHVWLPRQRRPRQCARCKSYLWQTAKKEKVATK